MNAEVVIVVGSYDRESLYHPERYEYVSMYSAKYIVSDDYEEGMRRRTEYVLRTGGRGHLTEFSRPETCFVKV
jgi:hypothetical protein